MTGCALTIVRARGRRLCKIIRPGGEVLAYDSAKRVDMAPVDLPDLAGLHALLLRLGQRSDCCIVRGAVADPDRVLGVRRLLRDDPKTGDRATLRDVPRRWIALDLDGAPLPAGVDPRYLAGCARAVLLHLPVAFRGAAMIAAATATHGIKPGARLRLWFWCDRPLSGAECKRWLSGSPVDRSVFGSAQPIYTAAPLFPGGRDHMPHRLVMLAGEPVVAAPAPAALAPPPPRAMKPAPSGEGQGLRRLAGLIRAVHAAPAGQRHPTLFWAACRAGELVARGGIGSASAAAALVQAAMDGGGEDRAKAEATARDGISRGLAECGRHG